MSDAGTALRDSPSLPDPDALIREARRRQHRRWAAITALVVIVAAIATATAALVGRHTRSKHHATRPARSHQITSARVGPPAGFLSAPFGTNVHTVSEWDWNGHLIRTLHIRAVAQCCDVASLSPDGTRMLVLGNPGGSTTAPGAQVLNTAGSVLAQGAEISGMWADDSRHLCQVRPHQTRRAFASGPADLVLVDPGHGERVVAQVQGYGPHAGPSILRCSVVDDQAIIAENVFGQNVALTAVRLSTGRTSTPRWAPAASTAPDVITISGNGRYALELSRHEPIRADIVDIATGRVVGHVDGQPQGISWNGRLVVVSTNTFDLEVVNWRTGVILWRSAHQSGNGLKLGTSAAVTTRPHSDDLALTINNFPGHDLRDAALWLITPSTPPKLLDNAVAKGAFY